MSREHLRYERGGGKKRAHYRDEYERTEFARFLSHLSDLGYEYEHETDVEVEDGVEHLHWQLYLHTRDWPDLIISITTEAGASTYHVYFQEAEWGPWTHARDMFLELPVLNMRERYFKALK